MGEWLVWLILGSLIVVVFCIYSLSSQLERCVGLAVDIITGNQRKIMAQLDALGASRAEAGFAPNVVPFERRTVQRRRESAFDELSGTDERRRSPGRRKADFAAQG